MKEISVQELQELREKEPDSYFLLDVRETHELDIATIGGTNIPLSVLQDRLNELESKKKDTIVVMCRSGGRSGQVVRFLGGLGFENVSNLTGGILAWSRDIDPSIPTY